MYFINPNLYVIISPPGEKCGLNHSKLLQNQPISAMTVKF